MKLNKGNAPTGNYNYNYKNTSTAQLADFKHRLVTAVHVCLQYQPARYAPLFRSSTILRGFTYDYSNEMQQTKISNEI